MEIIMQEKIVCERKYVWGCSVLNKVVRGGITEKEPCEQ